MIYKCNKLALKIMLWNSEFQDFQAYLFVYVNSKGNNLHSCKFSLEKAFIGQ